MEIVITIIVLYDSIVLEHLSKCTSSTFINYLCIPALYILLTDELCHRLFSKCQVRFNVNSDSIKEIKKSPPYVHKNTKINAYDIKYQISHESNHKNNKK